LKALAEVGLGERVETFRGSDGSWWEPGGRRLFAASQDRAVWLRQERGDGGWTAVGLIRSRIWLEKQGASRVGARVELKLSEMGASGPFEVVSVEPCPAIRAGGGCVVTGVFCHGAGRVYDLWLEGERGPLGVTAGHPIWSADRSAWVPAGALLAGECVQGVAGPVRVLRMTERGDAEVFTLEVDGDHCYREGEQGILVHNASTDVMITLTPAQVAEFNSIAQFRLDLELPAAGSAADNQTIAKLHIKGRVFWGGNSGTLAARRLRLASSITRKRNAVTPVEQEPTKKRSNMVRLMLCSKHMINTLQATKPPCTLTESCAASVGRT
jgi:hypothetical protein